MAKKNNLLIILTFFTITFLIIIKSYFNFNGYLTPDSANYLKLAQNLVAGNGFYVSSYGESAKGREFFAIWPVGYPVLIYLFSLLTGLSVFWASKFVNIIIVGTFLYLFKRLFHEHAYWYGAIFFVGSYIELFSFSLSESFFILLMFLLALCFRYFLIKQQISFLLYIALFFIVNLMFLTKYIGAFSIGLVGVLGLYFFLIKKDFNKAILLFLISAINICFVIAYLYNNYLETGFPTGMERIPAPESKIFLFGFLLKAILAEFILPIPKLSLSQGGIWIGVGVFLLQLCMFGYLFYTKRGTLLHKGGMKKDDSTLIFSLITVGSLYLFFTIVMRFTTHFDLFGYRTLSPGVFLNLIGVAHYLRLKCSEDFFLSFKKYLLVIIFLSFLLNGPISIFKDFSGSKRYDENIGLIRNDYDKIDSDSVVIFAPFHVEYLYVDMQRRRPYFIPYFSEKETWQNFYARITYGHEKSIFLAPVTENISIKTYHESVVDYISNFNDNSLVRLR